MALLFSAEDMRRAARLVNAMWSQPVNAFAAQRALEGGDADGIARAAAMACVLFAGTGSFSQERGAHQLQRMVGEAERLETQRPRAG